MKSEHIKHWQVGAVTITRIVEIFSLVDPPSNLFIDGNADAVKRHSWLRPYHATPDGEIILAFQAFLVRVRDRKILIDTCLGSDKTREHAVFEGVQSDFLDDIAALGAPAHEIDTVVCTHLHHDHVGWNTRRSGDKWVPSFARARYLFGRLEWATWQPAFQAEPAHFPHLVESVQPIVEAGLVDLVDTDHRVCPEVTLEPTPGHTPGHVCVHIDSQGQQAVITGDVMHHPVQCAEPDWRTHFCSDHAIARQTRRRFLERYQDRRALIIGSHFAEPTAGWIVRDGAAWRFTST